MNAKQNGGQGGIRTHGTLSRTLVFKTSAFNHSATCPHCIAMLQERRQINCFFCYPNTKVMMNQEIIDAISQPHAIPAHNVTAYARLTGSLVSTPLARSRNKKIDGKIPNGIPSIPVTMLASNFANIRKVMQIGSIR